MATPSEASPYRVYFERSPQALFVADAAGNYVDVNERACELVGYSKTELLDLSVADLAAEVESASLPRSFRRLQAEDTIETELQLEHADGHLIDVQIDAVALEDDTFVGAVRDISSRKERERRLRELKERFELAVEGANLGVWDWDLRTDTVEFNDQWAEILNLDPRALEGALSDWESRIHPEDEDRVMAAIQRHLDGETEYYESEHRMRTAGGDWKWIRDIGQVIERDEAGEPLRAVGIHQDIDDRKRAEAELVTARDRLRQIIDLVPDLVFVKDRDAEYLLANEAVAEAFGRPVEEIIGRTDYELLDQDPDTFHDDDLAVIESGEPKEIPEEVLYTADGERRFYSTVKIPYEPAGSEENAVLGYARDVTDLKEYERTLEEQRDSLEILNQTVRHDIRNDLQLVVAYADLLRDSVDESDQAYLEKVLSAAHNAIRITETAKTVADVVLQAEQDLKPVPLGSVLEDEIETARSNHNGVVVTVAGRLPSVTVRADDLLDSVFRNLLQNAIVHNDSDVPTVEVSVATQAERVIVEIADNGPGVPDEKKEAIFEEGVQGLDSDGTGLGLYIVSTLVDRYGGRVVVEDNKPQGAVFTVALPLVE